MCGRVKTPAELGATINNIDVNGECHDFEDDSKKAGEAAK